MTPNSLRLAGPEPGAAHRGTALPRGPTGDTDYCSPTTTPTRRGGRPASVPSDRFDILLDAARTGLRRRTGRARSRRTCTSSRRTCGGGPWQQSLFDPPDAKLDAVAKVKREINETLWPVAGPFGFDALRQRLVRRPGQRARGLRHPGEVLLLTMCTAIALALSELPVALVRQNRLTERIHSREGHEEFQFHWFADADVAARASGGR